MKITLALVEITIICLLTSCGTDIGAPDYGAREMPKQLAGESHDHYWQRLKEGHWF